MAIKLTILSDNSVKFSSPAIAEHGFACFIETDNGNYLFDTGAGLTIKHNYLALKKDLAKIKALLLSHGHYDHCGGLEEVLKITRNLPVYAHPDIFSKHYSNRNSEIKFCGIKLDQESLESLGADFRFSKDIREIEPGMYLTGQIPRTNDFEKGADDLIIFNSDGNQIQDPLLDDNSIVFETPKGLVFLFGCAHAGMINIIDYVTEKLNNKKVYAVIGGTHLSPASDERMKKTIDIIKKYNISQIGVSHCTGLEKAAELKMVFKDKFFFASVGTEFEV